MVFIKSLQIQYFGQKIISDIDDCIILTTKSIRRHRLNKRAFWFDEEIYKKHEKEVFESAEITPWGIELLKLIRDGIVKDYELVTAAKNRLNILKTKFAIGELKLKEGISDTEKVEFLNGLSEKVLYVDDKTITIDKIFNINVRGINYPKKLPRTSCFTRNSNRRSRKYKY